MGSTGLHDSPASTGSTQEEWRDKFSATADDLSAQAQHMAQRARSMAEPVLDKAREAADRQKDAGVEQMKSVAHAMHKAATDLEPQIPFAATLMHQAAEGLDRASSSMRHRSVDDLLQSVGDFARRQPLMFIGGMMLVGFALTRFLKSSASHDQGPMHDSGFSGSSRQGTAMPSGSSVGGPRYGSTMGVSSGRRHEMEDVPSPSIANPNAM